MKRIFTVAVSVVLLLVFNVAKSNAQQSLEETLSSLSSSAAKSYVAPAITAFGANQNSGWVSKLPPAVKVKLHIDLKIIAVGSFFNSDQKNFSANGDFYFTSSQTDQILSNSGYTPQSMGGQANYNQLKNSMLTTPFTVNFSGPTIAGSKDDYLKINFPGKNITTSQGQFTLHSEKFEVPDAKGFLDELPVFPSAAIQLTVGTVAGTNVSVRWFPDMDIKDMGKFKFFGAGAIHNPGAWFPNPLPIDLGIGYFFQKMTVGDMFETKASQFGIYAGKTFGGSFAFSPFIGLIVESSKTKVNYTASGDYQGVSANPKVEFELEGENKSGFIIGFNLKLAVVNFNADYKVSKTKTASAGISFGF